MREVIEVLRGPIDGANTRFHTAVTYKPGSVQVWVNGLLRRADYSDGWTEGGGTLVLLRDAPRDGDVVQAYYVPV